MTIKLHNTLTSRLEEFIPNQPGKVDFYVCGPTVYDYIHLGNARAFIVFDVLRRFFTYSGYEVKYVMNLTDVDDKIIQRAQKDGTPASVVGEKFSKALFEDFAGLGVQRADVHPTATESMDQIIVLIQDLIAKGFAYVVDSDVFFEVDKFPEYGKLSGKKLDQLQVGARIEVDSRKKNPLDFSLWKSQKPGEPAWDSPWGPGRPGWHIECSAMSMQHLGQSFDIHAGGVDLVFPHHENEIAQSECVTGKPFAKYWLHNGFLNIDGDKMSKSLGNFRTVREVLTKYPGVVLRMFFLQKHYRSPIDLTEAGLHAAVSASERLRTFYAKLSERLEGSAASGESVSDLEAYKVFASAKQELVSAMSDDMNTPAATARLFDIVREANKFLAEEELSETDLQVLHAVKADVEGFDSFFGVIGEAIPDDNSALVGALVETLIDVREALRNKKEWALADQIRDRLQESGIVLEDAASGTGWRKK